MNTPFRVKLNILTPFYLRHTLTLDALLSAAIYNKMGLLGEDTIPFIPLEMEEGIFKGSSIFYKRNYQLIPLDRVMNLRGDSDLSVDAFAPNGAGGKQYVYIDKKRLKYKAKLSCYSGVFSKEVFFWGVGDPEQVDYLLRNYILGIGKRSNAGAGEISDVEVIPVEEDLSWITKDGKPARPIPVELWKKIKGCDWPVIPHAVKIPYWSNELVDSTVPNILTI